MLFNIASNVAFQPASDPAVAKLQFQLCLMWGVGNGLLECLYWLQVFHTVALCYFMQWI